MNEDMTICECCDYLANMTDDKNMLEAIDYIQKKAIHMTVKLYERKKEVEKLDYLYHRSLHDYILQFDELQRYKKALDKACKMLEKHVWDLTKNEWKEWCFKE